MDSACPPPPPPLSPPHLRAFQDENWVPNSSRVPSDLVHSSCVADVESPILSDIDTSCTSDQRLASSACAADGRHPSRRNILTGGPKYPQNRNRPKLGGAASNMLGGSLHSALHRTNRTQKPYNFDDFGMRSPSTPDRRNILRKRFQRAEVVTSEMDSSYYQPIASQKSGHRHPQRRRQRHALGGRRRADLCVQLGGQGNDECNESDDEKGDDDSISCETDEDEESDSRGSPAVRAPSHLLTSRRPRKDSDDYQSNHGDHQRQLNAAIRMFTDSVGCGHHAGYQAQEFFATLAARQRRMIQIVVMALVVCVFFLYYELHFHLVRQEHILSDLSGKHAVVQRLHVMHQGSIPSADVDTDGPGGPDTARKVLSKRGYEDSIANLSNRVESLQATLQQMARQQLEDNFPIAFADNKDSGTASGFVDVKLDLIGHDSSLVLQLAGSKMPYTTWTFLHQLREGQWALQGNHQWFEIVHVPSQGEDEESSESGHENIVADAVENTENAPVASMSEVVAGATNRPKEGDREVQKRGSVHQRMDFLEASAMEVDRRFVLGMRNPKEGEGRGYPIVSIYAERGMCGYSDDEVCFGRVLEGFDLLNLVNLMADEEAITIVNVSVRQSESQR